MTPEFVTRVTGWSVVPTTGVSIQENKQVEDCYRLFVET